MREKLEILMADTGLRVGEIAAKLGVKAPVISHILSGRNQPNFVLTSKIISTFKEYNPYWWLGTSDVKLVTAAAPSSTTKEISTLKEENSSFSAASSAATTPPELGLFDSLATTPSNHTPQKSRDDIERVIVIYSDNSFESFAPRKR